VLGRDGGHPSARRRREASSLLAGWRSRRLEHVVVRHQLPSSRRRDPLAARRDHVLGATVILMKHGRRSTRCRRCEASRCGILRARVRPGVLRRTRPAHLGSTVRLPVPGPSSPRRRQARLGRAADTARPRAVLPGLVSRRSAGGRATDPRASSPSCPGRDDGPPWRSSHDLHQGERHRGARR